MIELQAGASPETAALVRQINDAFNRIENPDSPARLPVYDDTASLPPASQWKNCLAICEDVGGGQRIVVESDGEDWRRQDTGATL